MQRPCKRSRITPLPCTIQGSLDLSQNHLDMAEKSFLKVLLPSPGFAPALAGLGQVYWLKKQPDKAINFYQKAITADPETLLYRQQLITIYKATGQKEAESKASTEMVYHIPE